MKQNRLWIITPCFFDVPSFERVRAECLQVVRENPNLRGSAVSFVLIDDSAGLDREVKRLSSLPDTEILRPPYNLGHQGALVFALRTLGKTMDPEDLVLTLDSDGEDKPSDLPQLLEPLLRDLSNVHRIAIARRTQRMETWSFKLMYLGFKSIFWLLTGTVIRNGNFAAFRGWFLKEVIFHPHFDQCYSSSFISLPLQLEFVGLARGTRFFGKSKMGYFGLITHGFRMLMPFTEKIAIRGAIVSALLCGVVGVTLILSWLGLSSISRGLLGWLGLLGVNSLGIFVLLFATFSQTKARSLRGLRELS